MTEWLFFFRLKTKNLIKTKSQKNHHEGDSNSQTWDYQVAHSAAETTEDFVFETGLAGYIFNMNRPARQTTEVTRALWFRISPRPMFFVCRPVFHIGGCLYVYVCMIK